jgi:outer membrane protein TolC
MSLACAGVQAQEVFSLEKCREMALENNAKIRNAQLSVEAAEQAKKEAFTKYFPDISATGAGLVAEKPMLTMQSEHGATGMMKNELIGAVMAMQPLYAGGQIVNGNRLARAGVEASKLQQQMTADEVLLETERYFWQLVSLKEKMKTIAEADTMLRRVHNDARSAVEAGVANRNDLLRVELEQHRLSSARLKAENGLQMLKAAFGLHIGAASGEFDVEQPAFDDLALPDGEHDAAALQQRPEYQLLEKNVDIAALQVKMETGKNMPTVAVGAGYNYMNFDRGRPAEMEENFGMAFATVSVPLSGWWGGSHAIKKKKLELRAAETSRQEHADLLLLQMQNLHNELNEQYAQVQLAQQSIAVAEANVRMSEDQYKAGISILSDLLDAQNLLQQSRDQYVEAATEYCVKRAEYRQATGKRE